MNTEEKQLYMLAKKEETFVGQDERKALEYYLLAV